MDFAASRAGATKRGFWNDNTVLDKPIADEKEISFADFIVSTGEKIRYTGWCNAKLFGKSIPLKSGFLKSLFKCVIGGDFLGTYHISALAKVASETPIKWGFGISKLSCI